MTEPSGAITHQISPTAGLGVAATACLCKNMYMSDVMTVADARRDLTRILRRFRDDPHAAPIVVGAHRKPTAVISPIRAETSDAPSLRGRLHRLRDVIAHLASAARLRDVQLFGSVARGDESAGSDIDLLVTLDGDADYFDVAQFAMDVEAITGRRVDAVDRGTLPVGHPILAEAVAL